MHHSAMRKVAVSVMVGLIALGVGRSLTHAQSIWDKMKEAARKAQQQKQQPQQKPQPQQQSGPPQPGQRPTRGQQPAPAQAAAAASGPTAPPPGTKIEEKVMAPVQQGAEFTVSPRRVNVATVALSGSRQVVWYNGVEGPKFDEILAPQYTFGGAGSTKVAFSPDGNRYAYCARAGNEVVVMVDGKELARTSEPAAAGGFNSLCANLGFTSNSKHVYYLSQVYPSNSYAYVRLVIDGVSNPPGGWAELAPVPTFSPDGDHYAYIWNDPAKQKPWLLIIDGKPAPYRAGSPQWSADSKHLYTQMTVNLGLGKGTATDLLLDGKPIMRAGTIRLFIPPVGDMTVAAVVVGQFATQAVQFLVVGGRKVPGSEIIGTANGHYNDPVFSPDGKHYASKVSGTPGKEYVFVDGKKELDYFRVDKVSFTADSTKVVYQAWAQANKSFVVVGDQESQAFEGLVEPVTAPSGGRVGGVMSGLQSQLFVDGKTTRLKAVVAEALGFSPDGTRCAYIMGETLMRRLLVVDGVPQSSSYIGNPFMSEPRYVWSPDSKHIAHFHEGGGMKGVFLDGKVLEIPAATGQGIYTMLAFTPDSKHLVWARNDTMQGAPGFRVFVDGKPVYEGLYAIQGFFSNVHGSWEIAQDGTLSFVTQDDNNLKRVSIAPSPETSLDTMLAMAR
ncbi:MAG: hypothetical protein ACE145_10615 [Terriglobia bacterium]